MPRTDVAAYSPEVQIATGKIRGLCKKSAQAIIEIGKELIFVKGELAHGEFGEWLEASFGWDLRSAQRMMGVAQKFKSDNLSHFGTSALYLLACDSTPASAVTEAINRADAGEQITHKAAKEIVERHKEQTNPDAQDDADEVAAVLRGDFAEQHEKQMAKQEREKPSAVRTDADELIEKVQKIVASVDRMVAERMGHNAKSRAVVEHLNATIPLIKTMHRSWRNQ